MEEKPKDIDLGQVIKEKLEQHGVDLQSLCGTDLDSSQVKIACIGAGLGDSLRELGHTIRDQVVMVRIDQGMSQTLDAWMETGIFKSKSEAAAVFIREGLNVRAAELQQLSEALQGVKQAKQRLEEQAREVFGESMGGG